VTGIAGIYHDGRSSRAHAVELQCADGTLHTSGDEIDRRDPLAQIVPSAPLAGVPFTLRFADGARVQVPPDAPIGEWFPRHHRFEKRVSGWERRRSTAALAILVVALALVATFGWGVPVAADFAAMRLPAGADRVLGTQTLALMRSHWLRPSTLPETQRAELQRRFRAFVARIGDKDDLQLRFYQSRAFGANAFSLGGGIIVVTDALVRALPDDDALLAVVAHEMGHQHYRHMLRMVLRGSGVVLAVSVLAGDISGSTLATAIPVFLLNAHYSRNFEQQADDYAFAALERAGVSPMAFVRAMHALEKAHPELRGDADARYLSTHPVTQERIERALIAAQQFEHGQARSHN
jgi:Zn-dependent protease with chaperone function